MMKIFMNTKVDALKKKRDVLNARIKLVQNRESMKYKKDLMRRKILVGTYYLEQANKNGTFDDLAKLMDGFLIRDSDRKVFDLKPIKK